MKQYYKDGKLVEKPFYIRYKKGTVIGPKDYQLIELGYEIQEVADPTPNELIAQQREKAYQERADKYLMAFQAYTELGEMEKAADMKIRWIEERNRINEEFPYTEE